MSTRDEETGQFEGHEPTAETRRQVEVMVALGIKRTNVAKILGVCKSTLLKYYREELDLGDDKALLAVGQALYDQAVAGNTTAALFWLKARHGWRDRDAPTTIVTPPVEPARGALDGRDRLEIGRRIAFALHLVLEEARKAPESVTREEDASMIDAGRHEGRRGREGTKIPGP